MPGVSVGGEPSNDERIEAALSAHDHALAATLILRGLGPEILRFLAALHRNVDEAADVFSAFSEALWKSVPSFERRSSVRTWSYAVARRVSLHHRRDQRRRAARFQPFASSSTFEAVEAEVRTATLSFLRTERRTRLTALRESLSPEDQMLLLLRVDRKLPWNELALVLSDENEKPMSDEAIKREASRLRKRFQIVKDRLRELGQKEGLIAPASEKP